MVDVNGVGYELHVPLSTCYDVGDTGSDVSLRVHTHVREDALQLFGFLTSLEQLLFERLIGISGIGSQARDRRAVGDREPRARGIACSARTSRVSRSIPGIGKKTAGAYRARA